MNEVVREFLIETNENLAQLDLDLVALEKNPSESETLARVFRTLHTVKGTAGFLGLDKLQAVAHAAENLLSRLRDGQLLFNPEIASALLAVVDAVRQMLQAVEATEKDGDGDYTTLIQTLERLQKGEPGAPPLQPKPAKPLDTSTLVAPAPAPPSATTSPPPAPTRTPQTTTLPLEASTSFVLSPGAAAAPTSHTPAPAQTLTAVPSPEPLPQEATEQRSSAVSDSSIRVDVGLLDKLMNLVGELVLARNQIVQYTSTQESSSLLGAVQRLNQLTTELQTGVMKTRMQPIGAIWGKFPRVVRDMAVACGKQASLIMEGQETELDKSIIEAIRDPLTHLVRNAVDHGLETPAAREARGKPAQGRVALHAFHEGGKVIIEISDDGAGIDPQRVRAKAVQAKLVTPDQADRLNDSELINLVFLPGFSTADRVTQFSGRGVGMDVVRTHVEKIGGAVTLESHPGRGTTVRMKIPLTLAIIPALTVTSAGDRYAIPQVSLLELVRLEGEQAQRGIERMHGALVYRLRGNLLPIVHLGRVLELENPASHAKLKDTSLAGNAGAVNIVVLQADDRQFGLVVDAIHDTEEIVVKPLQKQLKALNVFAGATIMGDGKVALILDVLGLAQRANVLSGIRERALTEKTTVAAGPAADRQTVLLYATRDGGRMAIPLSQVDRLEEFPRKAVENVGPFEVVQYRNEILPLIHVSRLLRERQRSADGPPSSRRRTGGGRKLQQSDPLQVVVYAGKTQRVGLVVDRILDIAHETLASRSRAQRPGVLFTAVVQGKVTEFLDLEGIMRSAEALILDEPEAVTVEA
jgi:two-component system chemotaxis sensor kinase CheA